MENRKSRDREFWPEIVENLWEFLSVCVRALIVKMLKWQKKVTT